MAFGETAPQIDDDPPVDHRAHGGADLAALGEVALKLFAHDLEPCIAHALYRHDASHPIAS